MSKEAHVEFARVIIGNKTYLIRGDKNGVVIPDKLLKKMEFCPLIQFLTRLTKVSRKLT